MQFKKLVRGGPCDDGEMQFKKLVGGGPCDDGEGTSRALRLWR